MFACSEDKEIPVVTPPIVNPDSNENPKPVEVDSIYYQLGVDGFELMAATNDSTCLFLQTDTTFAFKCLYDSCGTNRLVAYSDSTGMVERIVIDEQVINILYHEDEKKIDIFYKNADNKISWIKELENPYKKLSSRAESGDVPYSAISVVNNLSYAVYTIIDTYDVNKVVPADSINIKFANKYANKESLNMSGTVAVRLITQILGLEYKNQISNHFSTIATVIFDYSNWVVEELYGDAVPVLRPYASYVGGYVFDFNDIDKDQDRDELMWQTEVTLNAYVSEAESLKNEFEVGVMVAEEGRELNKYYKLRKSSMKYEPDRMNYACSFKGLSTGKRYKFIPYLAPVSTSKYSKGMKGLLDFYKYNFSRDYLLLETKAKLISQEDDNATIKLSVENAQTSIKMGIIYSEHSDILKHEYKKVEYEPTLGEGLFSNNFEKEVKLENLKPGNIYYMPYIIYDDNILNHPIYDKDTIISTVITEKDQTFYGKLDSLGIIKNPITGDAIKNKNVLKFKGSFNAEINDITEYGICYSIENKEVNVDNSTVLKADNHQEGNFEVGIDVNEKDDFFFYRAYIKVKNEYYYGEIKEYPQISNPITGGANEKDNLLYFKGSFDTEIENYIAEYGICYNQEGKEITVDNSSVLLASAHQGGNFEVNMNVSDKDGFFYYRAYIIVKDNVYYGEIKQYEKNKSEIKAYSFPGENDIYIILDKEKAKLYNDSRQTWNDFPSVVYDDDPDFLHYWALKNITDDKLVFQIDHHGPADKVEEAFGKDKIQKFTCLRIYDDELIKRFEYVVLNKSKGEVFFDEDE